MGWYIYYDFEGFAPLEQLLLESKAFKPALNPPIIMAEFEIQGYVYTNGFMYSDPGILNIDYIPEGHLMKIINDYVQEQNINVYKIPKEFVSIQGEMYREERMRSFYMHKNYRKKLQKENENNDSMFNGNGWCWQDDNS
jgi:hypothetical protein